MTIIVNTSRSNRELTTPAIVLSSFKCRAADLDLAIATWKNVAQLIKDVECE